MSIVSAIFPTDMNLNLLINLLQLFYYAHKINFQDIYWYFV